MLLKFSRCILLSLTKGRPSITQSHCRLSTNVPLHNSEDQGHNIEFVGDWPTNDKKAFTSDMLLMESFITSTEEESLLKEVEPYLKRLRYEFDHWDDAIHGFRETERKHWYPENRAVFDRIQEIAFKGEIQPYIHVLDLAKDGVIKPHIDSVRYCGSTIAGVSLLSDCVMKLVRVDTDSGTAEVNSPLKFKNYYANILLPRYSLYIMRNTARYDYTHEILDNKVSQIFGKTVEKDRRISIICRNEPK